MSRLTSNESIDNTANQSSMNDNSQMAGEVVAHHTYEDDEDSQRATPMQKSE